MSSDNFHFVGPFGELWLNLSASEFTDIDGLGLYFYLNEWHREPQRCPGVDAAVALAQNEYSEYGTQVCREGPYDQPEDVVLEARVAALEHRVKYLDSVASQMEQAEDRIDRLERLVWALGAGLEAADANGNLDLWRRLAGQAPFSWAEVVESVDARQ